MIDAKNDESKSRLTSATAKEKLKVFGVPEEQIDPLTRTSATRRCPKNCTSSATRRR